MFNCLFICCHFASTDACDVVKTTAWNVILWTVRDLIDGSWHILLFFLLFFLPLLPLSVTSRKCFDAVASRLTGFLNFRLTFKRVLNLVGLIWNHNWSKLHGTAFKWETATSWMLDKWKFMKWWLYQQRSKSVCPQNWFVLTSITYFRYFFYGSVIFFIRVI